MRKLLTICLFLTALYGLERFCHKQTRGFAVHKISGVPLKFEEKNISQEVQNILLQPFYFLGKGGQSFVFESRDQKFVLKFFKQNHIRFWNLLAKIPFPGILEGYRLKMLTGQRHQSARFLYESCKLAETMQKEMGLVYVHLKRTADLQQCRIIDPLHISHLLDLNQMHFILQKKVEPSYTALQRLIATGQLSQAKQWVSSLIDLFRKFSDKEIENLDPNIRTNFGFLEGGAIAMDLGSYQKKEHFASRTQEKVASEIQKFQNWLHLQCPELEEHLKKKLEEERFWLN